MNGASILDFLHYALYVFDELHPLYVKLASEEKRVYSGFFMQRKKAEAIKAAYERALGLTATPIAELSEKGSYADKDMVKQYADGIKRLYFLYTRMVESRISVLKKYIENGLTKEVKDYNQISLTICGQYDKQYSLMDQQTKQHCKMCLMMTPYDNIYDLLADYVNT